MRCMSQTTMEKVGRQLCCPERHQSHKEEGPPRTQAEKEKGMAAMLHCGGGKKETSWDPAFSAETGFK